MDCGRGWTGWALEQLANIYVFDRESGEIQYRIGNLPAKVTALAWSRMAGGSPLAWRETAASICSAQPTSRPRPRS
jgi:hypothetical protein